MSRNPLKTLTVAGVALAAAIASPSVKGQTLHVMTAGSSAQWGVFAEAAYANAGAGRKHWTAKATPVMHDLRSVGNSIPDEPGNIWIVWNSAGDVWAYLSIDSTVGVRGFMASPRAHVVVPAAVISGAGANALNIWDDGSTDSPIPSSTIQSLFTGAGAVLTAANTDIRPEDAEFATTHSINDLGYSATNPILSSFNPAANFAHPIPFALSGTDPISGAAVTPFVTLPVGAASILFIDNRTDPNGLGYQPTSGNFGIKDLNVSNLGIFNAGRLFSGSECDTNIFATGSNSVPANHAVFPILREPLSGTMNTTEFTNFHIAGMTTSQEDGITTNPVNQPCSSGGGSRYRAVGTGDEVNAVLNTTAAAPISVGGFPLPTADQIGYIFFSFEAVTSIAGTQNFGYLTLDGVDGSEDPTASSTQQLPVCLTGSIHNCVAANDGSTFNSFPNLRNGSYRSWSEYRVISDSTHSADAQSLVTSAMSVADLNLPDFVPFAPQCSVNLGPVDPGLAVYRQHFLQSGVSPNDGPKMADVSCSDGSTLSYQSLGGQDPTDLNNEAGGDVGGAIVIGGPSTPVPGPTGTRM